MKGYSKMYREGNALADAEVYYLQGYTAPVMVNALP